MRIHSVAACLVFCASLFAADLPRSTPEEQGIGSNAVLAFIEEADKSIESMHSFMLVRHGHVITEGWWAPYDAQTPHVLWSLSKSFTSTAVGIAIAEGKFSVDDEVLKFFPDEAPGDASKNLKSMRISDLLRMNTGQQTEPPRAPDQVWSKMFLAHPVPFKPGTHFQYNSMATYMCSAIVQKTTGQTVVDFLKPRLFEPLGIASPTWEASPQGISCGGWGLYVRTEDIAKFGQLYLQKGKWEGKQLVPEAWIDAATARQTSNGSNPKSDWDQGYGYQFWRCRNGAYRGDGAFGQYCIVMPEQDAVIAITSGVKDMQKTLDLIWDKLLPAMKPTALRPMVDDQNKLQAALKQLSLPPQKGEGTAAKDAGKKYVFAANDRKLESISLQGGNDGATTIVVKSNGIEQRIECAKGAWKKGQAAWGTMKMQPAAANGAWTADDSFVAKICFYQTHGTFTLNLKFSGSEVQCGGEWNVGFGPGKEAVLTGKAE